MPTVEYASAEIKVAAATGNVLGESPVWSVPEQALYWTDIRAPALFRLDYRTNRIRRWHLPELAGAVVLRSDGDLILALQSGLYAFNSGSSQLKPLHVFGRRHHDDRANDSRCDRQGRLWYSTMRDFGAARTGAVLCLDTRLNSVRAIQNVRVPNGICFSPDGGRMYFTDTSEGSLKAYTDLTNPSEIRNSGTVVPAGILPGRPDGATVDAEGYIWSARFGGGCVVRSSPDGRTHIAYPLPVSQPTSCSFGGPRLDRLFITTAAQGLKPDVLKEEPMAGSLLVMNPGTRGIEEPSFLG